MRPETLQSTAFLASGKRLRTVAALAISDVELWKQVAGKQLLTDFFTDCATKAGGTPSFSPTSAVVSDGGSVPVKNSAGTSVGTAVATVAGGVLTGAALPATQAVVNQAGTATIRNSAGTVLSAAATMVVSGGLLQFTNLPATVAGVTNGDTNLPMRQFSGTVISNTGIATVAAGVLTECKLPNNWCAVLNANKINATSVTGSGNFATFTVVNGVITAIALSAS